MVYIYNSEIPCKVCLILPMCKIRLNNRPASFRALSDMAWLESCNKLSVWMECSDQDEINKGRKLFGLDSIL